MIVEERVRSAKPAHHPLEIKLVGWESALQSVFNYRWDPVAAARRDVRSDRGVESTWLAPDLSGREAMAATLAVTRFGQNACRIFAIDLNQKLRLSMRVVKNVVC